MAAEVNWDAFYTVPLFDIPYKLSCWSHFRTYKKLLKGLDLKGGRSLEIGAGTGLLSKRMHDTFGLEPTMVESNGKAKEKFMQYNKGFGKYYFGDIFGMNLGDAFDLVFSDGLVEHYKGDKQLELMKIHRKLCKKGGYVVVFVPKKWIFSCITRRLVDGYEEPMSLDGLKGLGKEAGLEYVRHVEGVHQFGVLFRH